MGNPGLSFVCVPDGVPKARALVQMAKRLKSLNELPASAFDIKMLTSQVMLLPALFCQLTKDYVYKPDAFEAARTSFSKEAWQSVLTATELRSNWSPDAAWHLLHQVDPHFLEHAQRLGTEAMDIAASLAIEDPLWDELRLESAGHHIPANDHPCRYTREEFDAVAQEEARTLSKIPGVRSVYYLGSIDSPVPGMSDLDLMVVLEEDPTRMPAAAEATLRVLSRNADRPLSLATYIKWHEEIITSREELPVLKRLWVPEPILAYGHEEHSPPAVQKEDPLEPEISSTVLLFKEGTFQCLRILDLMGKPVLALRPALLRTHTIVYDIKISRECFGFDMPEFDTFLERISRLRTEWFLWAEPQRRLEISELLPYALAVVHRILAEAAIILSQKGVVQVGPIRQRAPFWQKAGDLVIRYEDRPKGFEDVEALAEDGALILPIEALPLMCHCRPFQNFEPELSLEALDAMLSSTYRDIAAATRRISEKNLLLSHRLRPLIEEKKGADQDHDEPR